MRFAAGQSVVHRLHPVVKLAWLVWATVAVFTSDSVVLSLAVVGCGIGLLWLSGVAPWRAPGARLWLVLGAGVVLAHALASRGGEPIWGPVTDAGLLSGVRAAGRLWAIILLSTVFAMTTEPHSLACALIKVGLPYRWGFALVTSLRLASVFQVEAHHVYQAQLVRGVAYDASAPRRLWLMLRRLCLPLVVSALRTAHCLSLSMEGRAFGLHRRRTQAHPVGVGGWDVVAAAALALSVVGAVWHGLRGV